MSVIIRLQNLAWSANALDIRRLFHGLCIPDGGVHIVGGENGDAFIAFSTDEDARKAMHMDGALLLQNPIKLYLSSKNEMQNVIAIARGTQSSSEQSNGGQHGGPPRHGMQGNMGSQGFNQGPDRGFTDRNQLPPPQMGFQAPPGPQAGGPFGRTPDRDEHFDDDQSYGRPGMNGPPNRRPPFDRGQESMGRPGPGRDDFMQDDFVPQQPPMDRMHDRGPPIGMDETRVVNRGAPHGRNFGPDIDARPPKQGILGDSPMGFGPMDDGPPRKILLADPVPDHRPVLAGNFPPEGMDGMMGMQGQDEHFMRRDHDRDRWEANGDEEFRGRRDRGERHSRFDNPDRRRFEEERHGGSRDRSPLRREHGGGRDRRPVQPFAAGADEHNVFVYVRNMPTNISYRDVRRFFSGCPIPSTGLKMINDEHGRRTGEAYVMFSSEQVTADALKKDGESMTGLVVHVGPSTKEDFDAAVDSYVPSRPQRREPSPPSRPPRVEPSRNGGEYFVEIRNIPFRAVRAEIKEFFAKLHVPPSGGPVMDAGSDGRFNGVIYLQLQDHRDLRNALDMNGGNFMGRTIEVVEARRRTFEEKIEKERNKGREREQGKDEGRDRNRERDRDDKEREKDRDGDKKADNDTKSSGVAKSKSERNPSEKFYCVKLDGLPYLANNVAVKDFFDGLEIAQRGIHLMHNERHQCTGIGYVEFVTSADCDKAVAKNKEYMGKRFILVEPITKRDMLDSMAKDRSDGRSRGSADRGRGRGRGMSSGGRGASNDGFGHERQERTSRFTSERSFDPQGFNSGGEMYDERRVERDFDRRAGDYNRPVDNYGGMDDMVLDNAVVVAMYNVPYRASPPDIVDFFQGFPVDPHSVQLLQTADGRRTGEVNVTFPSVEDAAMAVQQLDHQDFMGRAVELCIL